MARAPFGTRRTQKRSHQALEQNKHFVRIKQTTRKPHIPQTQQVSQSARFTLGSQSLHASRSPQIKHHSHLLHL